jgi:hypothetical protein
LDFDVDGFSARGTDFYVQDFQFVVFEVPFEVGIDDGQLLELLLCEAGEDGFEEVGEDVLTSLISEEEFEGEVDFGEHEVHGVSIREKLREGKLLYTQSSSA